MTSTSFNVGLSDNTRSSSRVLRPPGGGHTDIFGGEAEPIRGKRAGPPQTDSFQEAKAQDNAASAALQAQENAAMQAQAAQNGNSAPEPAAPAQPEPAPAPRAEPPQPAEPQKRVRVPPGGFSSGLW